MLYSGVSVDLWLVVNGLWFVAFYDMCVVGENCIRLDHTLFYYRSLYML